MPTALSPKNILAAVADTVVMSSSPSPIGFLMFFLTIAVTHLLYRLSGLKHMTSFWFIDCSWMTCLAFLLNAKNMQTPMTRTASIPTP